MLVEGAGTASHLQHITPRGSYRRLGFASVQVLAVVSTLVFCVSRAQAAEYTVRQDGKGSYTTIQACADAATAGDTCLVSAGTYAEHVSTKAGGTSDDNRVTFLASGTVTMRGFTVRHPYVTINGFDMTGYASGGYGTITLYTGGDYCNILNNTIRDGVPVSGAGVQGIMFYPSRGTSASHCIVRGNTLSNLAYTFMTLGGTDNLIEGNVFQTQNSRDYLYLFGSNHTIRRNIFRLGPMKAGVGNHPDWFQTFGQATSNCENILFEENWVQGPGDETGGAFCQINSGDGVVTKGILYDNVKNITLRRNVIINVFGNGSVGVPGFRLEHNTFYRMAYGQSGFSVSSGLTRSNGENFVAKNNVFLEGSAGATITNDFRGFYSGPGAGLSTEALGVLVTKEEYPYPTAAAIRKALMDGGYLTAGNGAISDKTKAMTDVSQFTLDAAYSAYKTDTYTQLMRVAAMDTSIKKTFVADYNYVAGAASAGFPRRRSSMCVVGQNWPPYGGYFCEEPAYGGHGINGGDPMLSSLTNFLGPDGVPFTLDDGLKPLSTSPLCGKGEGGSDIGAYSCDPDKVFPAQPKPPSNLTIR